MASRRMGALIDDLLQFSRMGRAEIHKMPVDLNAVVQEVIRELEPEIGKRKIDWQLPQLPTVFADKGMLLQVIENLLGNPLKFTRARETPKIEIGFEYRVNGEFVFFVRDNGAGFDMRYYKLFQVFQRLHTDQEFEGTGLGSQCILVKPVQSVGRTSARMVGSSRLKCACRCLC
jgi:light-regulated signal transduction histidine kinase (bacteriophytochrome)